MQATAHYPQQAQLISAVAPHQSAIIHPGAIAHPPGAVGGAVAHPTAITYPAGIQFLPSQYAAAFGQIMEVDRPKVREDKPRLIETRAPTEVQQLTMQSIVIPASQAAAYQIGQTPVTPVPLASFVNANSSTSSTNAPVPMSLVISTPNSSPTVVTYSSRPSQSAAMVVVKSEASPVIATQAGKYTPKMVYLLGPEQMPFLTYVIPKDTGSVSNESLVAFSVPKIIQPQFGAAIQNPNLINVNRTSVGGEESKLTEEPISLVELVQQSDITRCEVPTTTISSYQDSHVLASCSSVLHTTATSSSSLCSKLKIESPGSHEIVDFLKGKDAESSLFSNTNIHSGVPESSMIAQPNTSSV